MNLTAYWKRLCGWIFNNATYRADVLVRQWRLSNPVRREMAFSWIQRWLIDASQRWLGRSILLFELFSVLLIAAFFGTSQLHEFVGGLQTVDQVMAYFNGLWAVQFTVLALIYPIVLSLVSLSLQRRANAQTRLHIYLNSSAAPFTGASSMLLVLAMAIQYPFLTRLPTATAFYWTLIDSIWLILNLAGTSWFLWKTVEHTQPKSQGRDVLRYTINVLWPTESTAKLAAAVPLLAFRNGWLPKPPGDDNANDGLPDIWFHSGSMGKVTVQRNWQGERRLADVRLRPLGYAISRWLRKEARLPNVGPVLSGGQRRRNNPILMFPPILGVSYRDAADLCKTLDSAPLDRFTRLLIYVSFVWERSEAKPQVSVISVLDEQAAEVQKAIAEGEEGRFQDGLDELVGLHAALVRSSNWVGPDGDVEDIALVPDRIGGFNTAVHEQWARVYLNVLESCVRHLTVNESFFEYIAYTLRNLFEELSESGPEVSKPLLLLFNSLFLRLGRWWSKSVEDQGQLVHTNCEPKKLNPPLLALHDSAVKTFIGAWGSVADNCIRPGRDENERDWESLRQAGKLYALHLDETAQMFFGAVHRGDTVAARWMLDALQRWWEAIHISFQNIHYVHIEHEELITIELFSQKDWQSVHDAVGIDSFPQQIGREPEAIFAQALKNYWTDISCLVAYQLVVWGDACGSKTSISASSLSALHSGARVAGSGAGRNDARPFETPDEFLIAWLRQYHADGAYLQGYRARLNHLVERIETWRTEPMISGRVYSGFGAEDLDSIRDGQMLLLSLLVHPNWKPGQVVQAIINLWSSKHDSALRELDRTLEQWLARFSSPEFSRFAGLFEASRAAEGHPTFQLATELARAGIQELRDFIVKTRSDVIHRTQVSEKRLKEVSSFASARAFSKTTGELPINLFNKVKTVPTVLLKHSLTINSVNKGEYTEPELAQRSINEESWLAETVKDYVSGYVMNLVLRKLAPTDVEADSAERYWTELKRWALKIREVHGSPILLLENPTLPEWMWQWTLGRYDQKGKVPDDMQFSKDRNDKPERYLGTINGIEVYSTQLPSGRSLILAKESLRELQFTEYEPGRFVEASYSIKDGQKNLMDLKLTWAFDITTSEFPAAYLHYGSAVVIPEKPETPAGR